MPQYSPSGQLQVKYGIDVAIGATTLAIFEFDTGGNGFFAGYNPDYWNGVHAEHRSGRHHLHLGQFLQRGRRRRGRDDRTGGRTRLHGAADCRSGPFCRAVTREPGRCSTSPTRSRRRSTAGSPATSAAAFGLQTQQRAVTRSLSSVAVPAAGQSLQRVPGPAGADRHRPAADRRASPTRCAPSSPTRFRWRRLSGRRHLSGLGLPGAAAVRFLAASTRCPRRTAPVVPAAATTFPQCPQQCLPSLIDSGAPSTSVRLPGAHAALSAVDRRDWRCTGHRSSPPRSPPPRADRRWTWTFVAGNNGSVNAVDYVNRRPVRPTKHPERQHRPEPLQRFRRDVRRRQSGDLVAAQRRPVDGDSCSRSTTTGDQSYGQNAVLNGTYTTRWRRFQRRRCDRPSRGHR